MIRERATRGRAHGDRLEAVAGENLLGYLRSAEARDDLLGRVLRERLLEPSLHDKAEHERRDQKGEIETEAFHEARMITVGHAGTSAGEGAVTCLSLRRPRPCRALRARRSFAAWRLRRGRCAAPSGALLIPDEPVDLSKRHGERRQAGLALRRERVDEAVEALVGLRAALQVILHRARIGRPSAESSTRRAMSRRRVISRRHRLGRPAVEPGSVGQVHQAMLEPVEVETLAREEEGVRDLVERSGRSP